MKDNECPVKDWTTDYDVMDTDYASDPYRIWKEMRDSGGLVRSERWGGSWMATRYADLQNLVRQVSALSSRAPTLVPPPPELRDQLIEEVKAYGSENPPITSDPPEHKPFKQLILPYFTPAAVEGHRKFAEELCHQLIDKFIARGACDAAEEYAQQIPPRVIARIIGIDPERGDDFTEWTRGLLEFGQTNPEMRIRYRDIIRDFFGKLVAARRAEPRDDLVSQLIAAQVNGEPVNDHTIIGMCNLLLVAGIDTTWSSIGSSLWHFAGNQGDRRRMTTEPDLFPTAIEELLRYYAPVMMARRVLEPVSVGNSEMQPRDKLILNFPAGNHDPEVFERANEVVLDRQRNRHIAFGVGIHRCAGSNLARMEMDVALRVWFSRIPEFELSDPDAVTWAGGQVRGPRSIPVRFPT